MKQQNIELTVNCGNYHHKTTSTKTKLLLCLSVLLLAIQLVNCSSEEISVEDDNRNSNNHNNGTLTSCQHLRSFESRRAKALGRAGKSVRIPKCSKVGEFEPVQCSNELNNNECFCVDEYGVEIAGTRTDREENVNCTTPMNSCPAASCRMFCSAGFARDLSSGCSICKCRDPCNGIQCPNGQACEAIEVACSNEPCPPVPTCRKARSITELCPAGSPLSIAGTPRPFLCGNDPGKPSCPPLYKCLVQSSNDYGVCCPASLKFEKPGTCPRSDEVFSSPSTGIMCGSPCGHDLECSSMQKCCVSNACGRTCQQPQDVTLCHQAKLVSEILSVNEREGRGYVPQCDVKNGMFVTKQCSNNGLVCWCVDPSNGNKIKGTMAAAKSVQCDNIENLLARSGARSIDGLNQCDQNICAAICQYGFKNDHNGCSTCECSEPCEGFTCPLQSHCEVAKDPKCLSDSGLCLSEPVCKPDIVYSNPCDHGTPLTSNFTDEVLFCHEERSSPEYQSKSFYDSSEEVEGRAISNKITCPQKFKCTRLPGQSENVCCPTRDDSVPAAAEEQVDIVDRPQSMCEYLRDFSERMEGTEEGMTLALRPPRCMQDGAFASMQCQIKRMSVTKAEQKKVLEQNNIREMRKLFVNRKKRSTETLKLVRVDSGRDFASRDLNAQTIVDYLKQRVLEAPERFITDLFSMNGRAEGRTAKLVDIQAEDYDEEEEEAARNDRKISLKSQQKLNGLVDVDMEECFCVDGFGTEIPQTRGTMNVTESTCNEVKEGLECLDLTCRMGCDYGFILDHDTQCPTCSCRDPCEDVQCDDTQECRTVEVSCEGEYCPPVPACFPKKQGQCPYLVPPASEDSDDACDYECRSDSHCSESKKCCSNGCGTVCVEPQLKTACQHLQSIQIHQAIELGIPAKQKYISQCNDDGAWKTIQCGPNNAVCWCVDERGNEKSGTRTSTGVPNCEVSKSTECPLMKCKPCENGYDFDEQGCKTCQCKDLCKDITCPRDEQCELVSVECISLNNTLPCPRMPICAPIRDSICTEGLPLKSNGREINCGPDSDSESCPTTHSCNLNPISKRGVCCGKSRDVCFESLDSSCLSTSSIEELKNDVLNIVKWRFSPQQNKCMPVTLPKVRTCSSKNLFHNEKACKSVCPVLSQCERLRLKNSIAARRRADKSDIWFRPRCDEETGSWSSVQCIGDNSTESIGVCWCADKKGSPIKGSLTKGAEPSCNHRQARGRMQVEETDPVMEELIRQITFLTDENNFMEIDSEFAQDQSIVQLRTVTERIIEMSEQIVGESTKRLIASTTRCDALRSTAQFAVKCDERGMFEPTQCNYDTCWCVDEAGNQLPWSNTFRKGSKSCIYTPLDAVEVELHLTNPNGVKLRNLYDVLYRELSELLNDGFANFRVQENSDGTATMRFDLIEETKVNQAFAIEEMSKDENLFLFNGMLRTDITQSKFSHKVPMNNNHEAQKASLGIPQNTFHTIVFVLATSSAFIISVLVIYVMLKRGKDKNKSYANKQIGNNGDKFVDYTSPIFVLSANDIESRTYSSVKK